MKAAFGRMIMCHMIADSSAELLAMAAKINLDAKWLQNAGSPTEHFDLSLSYKRKALAAGAVLKTQRQLAFITREKRNLILLKSSAPLLSECVKAILYDNGLVHREALEEVMLRQAATRIYDQVGLVGVVAANSELAQLSADAREKLCCGAQGGEQSCSELLDTILNLATE
jgi:ribosomal protein L16 Arg81 hydroxylase